VYYYSAECKIPLTSGALGTGNSVSAKTVDRLLKSLYDPYASVQPALSISLSLYVFSFGVNYFDTIKISVIIYHQHKVNYEYDTAYLQLLNVALIKIILQMSIKSV